MSRLQVRVLLIVAVVATAAGVVMPRTSASAANAPNWKPVGDATSSFSAAVMRWDHAKAKLYLTSSLRKQVDTSSVHRMLGIQVTPHRYWYWVNRFDGQRAHVSLTYYFPDACKPVTNHLEWVKVGTSWQISKIVRGTVPTSAPASKAVSMAAEDLGYAVIRGDNATINRHATTNLLKAAPAGHLVNLLGMQNLPSRFTYTVDSVQGPRATVNMTWMFGRSTVVDRLQWVGTADGWRIANVEVFSA